MDRTPLRRPYASATLALAIALLLSDPALAHVDVQPRLVEQGKEAVLRIELPQLRAGAPPVRLEVEGAGVTAVASRLLGVASAETRWSVRVRIDSAVAPGELLLVLRALFADGESVEVDGAVTVVPSAAVPADSFPWLGVAAGVTVALTLALGALLVARRRS